MALATYKNNPHLFDYFFLQIFSPTSLYCRTLQCKHPLWNKICLSPKISLPPYFHFFAEFLLKIINHHLRDSHKVTSFTTTILPCFEMCLDTSVPTIYKIKSFCRNKKKCSVTLAVHIANGNYIFMTQNLLCVIF